MLTEALIGVLTQRFQASTVALANSVGNALQLAWLALPGYDEGDIPRFEELTAPATVAAKAASVRLSAGYYSLLAQVQAPTVRPAMVGTTLDAREPFIAHWRALNSGRAWNEALGAGADRASAVASDFVVSTTRQTADVVYESTDTKVVGWRRVLDGGACDWCQLISTQRYRSAESADFGHRNCHCSAVPIIGDRDPGRVINKALLAQIKSQ